MNEDKRRQPLLRWGRVAVTMTGILGAAVAMTFVVREAGSATTVDPNTAPPTRTVVAVAGPHTPTPQATAVTVTVPPTGVEIPVLITPSPALEPIPGTTPGASPSEALAPPDPTLRQIVYTVAGNQRPDDPVTIVYADDTGALRTEENVSLPWTKAVIPSLDAPINYITASSNGSQLNCWITDVNGTTLVSQVDNTISATCNR